MLHLKKGLAVLMVMVSVLLLFAAYPTMAENEVPTLTILMAQQTLVDNYEENYYTQYIESNMGVNLDFELLPATDAANKLAIMISSGQKLPDIVNFDLGAMVVSQYAQAGAFIPLNEYYALTDTNLQQVLNAYPEFKILQTITAPDGNIYAVPSFRRNMDNEVMYKLWMNNDWLEAVNMELPTTTEELYEVLKAFKEQDPNGNGLQDEYPLVGGTGWSQDPTVFLMNAFTYDDSLNHLQMVDGQVQPAFTQDAWREGLRYMYRLVSEKLLEPVTFTQTDGQLRALVNDEEACLAGAFAFSTLRLIPEDTGLYSDQYIGLPPLMGPEGVQYAGFVPSLAGQQWFITPYCNDPELAFRVGDFQFTEDAFMINRYGAEGVDWRYPETGEISVMPGYEPKLFKLQDAFNMVNHVMWRHNAPNFDAHVAQGEVWNGDPMQYAYRVFEMVDEYQKHIPKDGEYVPNLVFTEDESFEISEIRSTINTYVNECKVRFITGDMNIETGWDSYLAELDAIGLDRYMEIAQIVYERMYK